MRGSGAPCDILVTSWVSRTLNLMADTDFARVFLELKRKGSVNSNPIAGGDVEET